MFGHRSSRAWSLTHTSRVKSAVLFHILSKFNQLSQHTNVHYLQSFNKSPSSLASLSWSLRLVHASCSGLPQLMHGRTLPRACTVTACRSLPQREHFIYFSFYSQGQAHLYPQWLFSEGTLLKLQEWILYLLTFLILGLCIDLFLFYSTLVPVCYLGILQVLSNTCLGSLSYKPRSNGFQWQCGFMRLMGKFKDSHHRVRTFSIPT